MDLGMLDAAGQALLLLLEPYRLMVLAAGVILGLTLGILPGIGGLAGTALLLPFTFGMDPYTAFAFLLGLAATTSTGDPIPAIIFGVPGGAGSAVTVLDGLPMAKRGEAGRALSAAYMSSMLGGLFGAALLGLSLPVLRPLVLYIGSPELLAFAVFGISMVAVLSGSSPLRGMAAAGLGITLAMVGSDPQSGTLRWTFDTFYLWEGLPLVPMVLGLFALPELCDLAIGRTSITTTKRYNIKAGMLEGAKDCFRNWWLVLRCSWLGASLGAIPGLGGAVIGWLVYGHAIRTEKGADRSFGKGDVRGVIASESSNNATEGGSLVPTIAFGVPGSASMAILLGAFTIHGLVPGPDMLTVHLSLTYSMVWSIALANILGAGLCYMLSGQFARLATLRYTLILPTILSIVFVGAFEGSRQWGDLYVLLSFGVLGWTMKQLRWSRPPLILGLVLGDIIERYMFISIERYGGSWLTRPVVVLVLGLTILGFLQPLRREIRNHGGLRGMLSGYSIPRLAWSDLLPVFLIILLGVMLVQASSWTLNAKLAPMIVGSFAILFATMSLLNQTFRRPEAANGRGVEGEGNSDLTIHMDLQAETTHLPGRTILVRAATFFSWLVGIMALMAAIGLIPTIAVFVIAYMRLENREPWKLVIPQAVCLVLFVYVVFDQLLTIPWPGTLLGQLVPAMRVIPSV